MADDASINESLPPELLRMILNGAAAPVARPTWQTGRSPRLGRPFLDPRWRFAARSVCRLWHDVIVRPTAVEAAAMGRHPHQWPIVGHVEPPLGCPKWPSGRVVCASAVADAIAAGRWNTVDAVYSWCAYEASATRKQVMAAVVASGNTHMADQALASPCPFGTRPASTPCARADTPNGWAIGWDDDQGTLDGLIDVLWHVGLERASVATLSGLCARRGVPCSMTDALCAGGRGDEAFALAKQGRPPSKLCWVHACAGPYHMCFARLLDMAAAGLIAPPPPAPPDAATGRPEATWFGVATVDCRWRIFAVLEARGMPFDLNVAFEAAARARRLNALQWLWSRALARGPKCQLDVRKALVSAIQGRKRPTKAERVVSWLCSVCPRAVCPFNTIGIDQQKTLAKSARPGLVLCLVERWPHTLFETPDGVTLLFRRCVTERSLDALGRLLRLVDDHAKTLTRDDPFHAFDLWDTLTTMCAGDSHFAFVPMLALMRIAKALADGSCLRARDVALFDRTYNREIATPCRCVGHPTWRHDGDASACERRRVDDDPGPCRSERLLASLAPLQRWCRARPVQATRMFPDWTSPSSSMASPEPTIQDAFKSSIIEWLVHADLLLDGDNVAKDH